MKLEIIALLICTIMGRTRRRRGHHAHVSGDGGNSSYSTVDGVKVEKPAVVAEVAADVKRFMRRRAEDDVVDSKDK